MIDQFHLAFLQTIIVKAKKLWAKARTFINGFFNLSLKAGVTEKHQSWALALKNNLK